MTTGPIFLKDGGRTYRSVTGCRSIIYLFPRKEKLVTILQLWWHPPMPRHRWKVNFHCPMCRPNYNLWSNGVYNLVHLVMDTNNFYYLAGEYMECGCGGTFISSDQRFLAHWTDDRRSLFPAVLTRKYACDRGVVAMMTRPCNLGKSLIQ